MARRLIRTDRLIVVLGMAVLALGAVAAWKVVDDLGVEAGSPNDRVRRQLREYDPDLTLFEVRAGRTRGVVCGYAGVPYRAGDAVQVQPIAFVSRRNRLITTRDPLRNEFKAQTDQECPDLIPNLPTKRN